jgi:hypothetical protein
MAKTTKTTKTKRPAKRGRKRLPPVPVIALELPRDLYRELDAVTRPRRALITNEIRKRLAASFRPPLSDVPDTMAELQLYLDKILETYANRPLGSASVEVRQYDMHQVLRLAAETVDRLCDVLRFQEAAAAVEIPIAV